MQDRLDARPSLPIPRAEGVANQVTINSGRIGVKKSFAQKEAGQKVNCPASICCAQAVVYQYL